MSLVHAAGLHEGVVVVERPFIANTGVGAERRRVGSRATERSVGIRNVRDRFTEIRAGRVVVDQKRRVRLRARVPGGRSGDRQAVRHAGDDGGFDPPDAVARPVGRESQVAEPALRVEEAGLSVAPDFLIDRAVELNAVIEPLGLPADLVVRHVVRHREGRNAELVDFVHREVTRRRAIELARPKAL